MFIYERNLHLLAEYGKAQLQRKECLEDIFRETNSAEMGGRLLVQKQKVNPSTPGLKTWLAQVDPERRLFPRLKRQGLESWLR